MQRGQIHGFENHGERRRDVPRDRHPGRVRTRLLPRDRRGPRRHRRRPPGSGRARRSDAPPRPHPRYAEGRLTPYQPPVMTRSPSACTSFTSNRAAPTSSLTGCAPSASSKPPEVPRFIYADAVLCRGRFDPAWDGRGVASPVVVGVTREGCGLAGRMASRSTRHMKFRKRNAAPRKI